MKKFSTGINLYSEHTATVSTMSPAQFYNLGSDTICHTSNLRNQNFFCFYFKPSSFQFHSGRILYLCWFPQFIIVYLIMFHFPISTISNLKWDIIILVLPNIIMFKLSPNGFVYQNSTFISHHLSCLLMNLGSWVMNLSL